MNDRDGNGRIAQAIVGAIVSGIIAFALYYLEYWISAINRFAKNI